MTTAVTVRRLDERRDALAAATSALKDLHTVLFQCPSGDLAGLAGDLAELRALAGAGPRPIRAQIPCRQPTSDGYGGR